jgi:anti-anti-sigma factor
MAAIDDEHAAEIEIETRHDADGVPVVVLAGELDTSNAGSLQRTVASLTSARPDRIVFDVSGLRFMDSAGIAVLIGAAAQVETVELRNPSPIVRRVVEITGLAGTLQIVS